MSNTITLDGLDFKEVFSAAIIQHMQGDSKDKLIQQAIAMLIEPRESGISWSSNKKSSILEDAFKGALHNSASRIVSDHLDNDPEYRKAIESICVDSIKKLIDGEKESIVEKVVWVLRDALSKIKD